MSGSRGVSSTAACVVGAGAIVLASALSACGSSGDDTDTLATVVTGDRDRTEITGVPASPRSTVPRTSPTPPPSSTTSATPPPPSTSAAPPSAPLAEYEGSEPGFYYFTTPSGKFECAVVVTDSSVAGCHGSFPDDVPRVEGSGAPDSSVAPNTVQLTAGSTARFLSSGDPRFHRFDGTARELPYGTVLAVPGSGSSNGLTCTVDERKGVSCADQVGHSFTVSDTSFDLR